VKETNLQFRVEAFNIFNHTQFSSIDNHVGTDFFMRATGAHMARVVQLALKFEF
jgi:hypothetical protein